MERKRQKGETGVEGEAREGRCRRERLERRRQKGETGGGGGRREGL
jgi:hypothetical protein